MTLSKAPAPADKQDLANPAPHPAAGQSGRLLTPARAAILIVFLVQLLLVSPRLMPAITSINVNDEAKYVESGRLLLRGEIRDLSWGPLVALVYAPLHLVVGNSPDWFLLETWGGRFILFACMWFSLLYLAARFKHLAPLPVTAGLLFVTTAFFPILENQSDALFVSFSALALARLIDFSRQGRLRDLILAGIFTGLGVLARVETVLLVGMLTLLAVIIGRKRHAWYRLVAAAALPAAAILSIYFIASLLTQGTLTLSMTQKSYQAFRQNQSVMTGGDDILGEAQADQLFGTEEENNGSVIRAILRNPLAFARRILTNLINLPNAYLAFFGKLLGISLLLFAAWGAYTLIARREWGLLALLLIWPLHALFALGFLARHVVPQSVYLTLILGAVGISGALKQDNRRWERLLLLGAVSLLAAYGLLTHKPGFLLIGLLLAAVFALAWLFRPKAAGAPGLWTSPLWMLLAAGLILHGAFPFPNYEPHSQAVEDQVVHYLLSAIPAGQTILAPNPLASVAAKLNAVDVMDAPENVSAEEVWAWLKQGNITAAYVDERYGIRQDLFGVFAGGEGQYFSAGFTSADGLVHVYLVK